jgi:hypothetical protein
VFYKDSLISLLVSCWQWQCSNASCILVVDALLYLQLSPFYLRSHTMNWGGTLGEPVYMKGSKVLLTTKIVQGFKLVSTGQNKCMGPSDRSKF